MCGHCGKAVKGHFKRHFQTRHPGVASFKWDGKNEPKEPFCKNWREVLESNAKPIYFKIKWKDNFEKLIEDVKRDPKKA